MICAMAAPRARIARAAPTSIWPSVTASAAQTPQLGRGDDVERGDDHAARQHLDGREHRVLTAAGAECPVPKCGHEPHEGDPGEREHVEARDERRPPGGRVGEVAEERRIRRCDWWALLEQPPTEHEQRCEHEAGEGGPRPSFRRRGRRLVPSGSGGHDREVRVLHDPTHVAPGGNPARHPRGPGCGQSLRSSLLREGWSPRWSVGDTIWFPW